MWYIFLEEEKKISIVIFHNIYLHHQIISSL